MIQNQSSELFFCLQPYLREENRRKNCLREEIKPISPPAQSEHRASSAPEPDTANFRQRGLPAPCQPAANLTLRQLPVKQPQLLVLSFINGFNNALAAHFIKVIICFDIQLRRYCPDDISGGGNGIPARSDKTPGFFQRLRLIHHQH